MRCPKYLLSLSCNLVIVLNQYEVILSIKYTQDYLSAAVVYNNLKLPKIQLIILLFQEALRLASVAEDQGCYARAVRIAGDVYRRKCDVGKALRYIHKDEIRFQCT